MKWLQPRVSALLSPALLLICSAIIYPVAEIGINDDWSYIKSAEVLAQTGHITYNGWATAMLGWQLLVGAAFAKLFGASFTAVRMGTLLVALATSFLVHRVFCRAGLTTANATFGALVFTLSPLFIPLALSFMSDIYGLFAIVLCMYPCLRAIEADSDRASTIWIAFASLSNVIGGTSRQIAWLGVLVMVPSTLWILRKRRHVVERGVLLVIVSIFLIFASVLWFLRQPYSVPELIHPAPVTGDKLLHMGKEYWMSTVSLILFLCPIFAVFIPSVLRSRRRLAVVIAVWVALCAGMTAYVVALAHHRGVEMASISIAPPTRGIVTTYGFVDVSPLKGMHPMLFPFGLQVIILSVALFAAAAFLGSLRRKDTRREMEQSSDHAISGHDLLVLVVPFLLAYYALLLPRATFEIVFDRYLLPILFIFTLLLLRWYQGEQTADTASLTHPWARIPRIALIGQLVFVLCTVIGVHDLFAIYRSRVKAINELLSAGIPDTAIDGGFEFNGMTQIEHVGYMNYLSIRVPRQLSPAPPSTLPEACRPQDDSLTPVVMPRYTLSYSPDACGGESRFAPVTYQRWIGMQPSTVYIVNTISQPKSGS